MADLLNPDLEQVETAFAGGCPACLKIGCERERLRTCLPCGHIGCRGCSPRTHARLQWQETGNAVTRAVEHGEGCYFNCERNGHVT